jgi:anti-sigma regulatory factor (Ser/Thr protein kinase)
MAEEKLTLNSRLSEMLQLSGWLDHLASRYAVPDHTKFAMNLCLEEAISNIIRHGYCGNPDGPIVVHFTNPGTKYFVLELDDEAPHFNPLAAPDLPAMNSLDDPRVGGQGIRLLRRFADSLHYQATPQGNRLVIGFSATNSAVARD